MKIFLKIFFLTLLIKASLVVVAIGLANYTEYNFKYRTAFQWETLAPSDWTTVFHRFDSNWFRSIAKHGHEKIDRADLLPNEHNGNKQSYYAFFPAYPFLNGMIMKATGAEFITVAFFVSLLLSPLAFYLFYRLAILETKSDDIAWLATLCIMLFPTNYYYYTYYTEALYLLAVLSVFVFTYHKKYVLLCVAMTLLTLVRPNGLLMALPLVLWVAENFDPGFKSLRSLHFKPWRSVIIGGVVMAGTIAAYCFYLYEMTGDPFAFSTAQKGWQRDLKWPWFTIMHAGGFLENVFAAYTLFMLFCIMLTLQHWRLSFFVLMLISVIVPLSTGLNTSMPRFWSVIFPLFIVMGVVIGKWKYGKWLPYVFWLMMLLNFVPWVLEDPFAI